MGLVVDAAADDEGVDVDEGEEGSTSMMKKGLVDRTHEDEMVLVDVDAGATGDDDDDEDESGGGCGGGDDDGDDDGLVKMVMVVVLAKGMMMMIMMMVSSRKAGSL